MASRRRSSKQIPYRTYGNVAYAPAYEGNASPHKKEKTAPRPKQRPLIRGKTFARTHVQVREAGEVSVFAVMGFLAVGVLAALLMFSFSQQTVLNRELNDLRKELSILESDNATLSAQYEKVFDLERIQQAVGDQMVRPTTDQIVYIDLSEPDNVILYGEERTGGIAGALQGFQDVLSSIAAYFH
ncbi:MAG: hypothetical protein HFF33_01705 [Oscillospiraceae bacterium]|nr:hypothetical protein [Oscillospiraceae bacterium]